MASGAVLSKWPVERFLAEKGVSLALVVEQVARATVAPVTVRRWPGVGQPTPDASLTDSSRENGYALIASSVDIAASSLDSLGQGIADTAGAFRRRDIKDANRRLVRVAEGLRLVSALADMAASASGLDLDLLSSMGPLDSMGEALDELTARQFAENWNGVAQTLEDAVQPALAGWREVFAEILVFADGRFRQPSVS
jgi:hypothetical protein